MLLADRNVEQAQVVAARIAATGRRAAVFELEISRRESARAMAEAALEELGRIDILVNSAGMNVRKPVLEIGEEDWDAVMAVNLKGILWCCQAVAPHMIERGSGKIISIASVSSRLGHPARGTYAASKGGLIQLTRVMATEWAPHHVCVNAISPAAVDTPFIAGLKKDRQRLDRELERIPLGRLGTPRGRGRGGRVPGLPGGGLHHGAQPVRRRRAHRRLKALWRAGRDGRRNGRFPVRDAQGGLRAGAPQGAGRAGRGVGQAGLPGRGSVPGPLRAWGTRCCACCGPPPSRR